MNKDFQKLPVSLMRDVKDYSVLWFSYHALAISEVYLVDKVNHKILMYKMNRQAENVTLKIKRRYEMDKGKNKLEQRVVGRLYQLMENHDDTLHSVDVIAHSDSAIEIIKTIQKIRMIQAEWMIKYCKNSIGFETENAAVKYFSKL